MEEHRPPSIIYVELDAYLDTRLSSLAMISPAAALECKGDPRYFDRVIDDFEELCGVTRQAYRNAYSRRDEDCMRNAVITEIPFILNELVLKLEKEAIDTPFLSRVVVEVNVYPYKLDEESRDAIALAVMARAGIETEVRCIYMTPEQVTPTFVRGRYSGMIIYNFREWMECHLKEFDRVKMPRVSVLAPALWHDVVPSAEAFTGEGVSSHITGFQLSEVAAVELFALSLLPAANFSMVRVPGHYQPKAKVDVPIEDITPAAPSSIIIK